MRQSEGAESNGRYRLSRVNRASLSGKVTFEEKSKWVSFHLIGGKLLYFTFAPCMVPFSCQLPLLVSLFVCLFGRFWTLSPVGKLCSRVWWSSADHSYWEAGPKTHGKLCLSGWGLSAGGAHCYVIRWHPGFFTGELLPPGLLSFSRRIFQSPAWR